MFDTWSEEAEEVCPADIAQSLPNLPWKIGTGTRLHRFNLLATVVLAGSLPPFQLDEATQLLVGLETRLERSDIRKVDRDRYIRHRCGRAPVGLALVRLSLY